MGKFRYAPLLHLKTLPPAPMPVLNLDQLFALAKEDYRQIRRRRLAEEKVKAKQERKL